MASLPSLPAVKVPSAVMRPDSPTTFQVGRTPILWPCASATVARKRCAPSISMVAVWGARLKVAGGFPVIVIGAGRQIGHARFDGICPRRRTGLETHLGRATGISGDGFALQRRLLWGRRDIDRDTVATALPLASCTRILSVTMPPATVSVGSACNVRRAGAQRGRESRQSCGLRPATLTWRRFTPSLWARLDHRTGTALGIGSRLVLA